MPDVSSIPFKQADPNGHYRSKQLPNDSGDFMQMLGLPAFAGDVVGPGGTTPGQATVFSDATGKRIDAATQTGLAKLSGGVLSSVAAPVGDVVGTTDPQILTNKTLINPTLEGVTGFDKDDVGLGNVDNTADAAKPVSGPQQAALDLKEDKNKKAVANGYASLDASVKVPLAQIPDSVLGGQQYQGTWNAATNTPAIPTAAIGNKGWYYSVSVAGTTNINGISSWAVGDEIISNGSVWQKIVNVSAVNSVNGYTGVVVLGKADVGLGNVDNTSDSSKPVSTATATQLALKEDVANKNVANGYAGLDATGKVPAANVPADLVTSVASKQGVVTLVKGDVGLGNVDNTSDATKNSASATLTNKTINGANNTLTVRLGNDVTGNLPVTNLNAGTGANSGSFWRGDGQWAPPAGGGDVIGPAGAVDGDIAVYNGATGKIIKTIAGKVGADLVAGPSTSVDGELPLYSGTTGKVVKRCNLSGFVKAVSSGAATAQTQMGAVDLHPDVIHAQSVKSSVLLDADEFLVWDSSVSALRRIANSTVVAPGEVVQMVAVTIGGTPFSNVVLPYDTTIPQISEGTALFGSPLSITLKYATSKVLVTLSGGVSRDASLGALSIALFRDSVASAISARAVSNIAANALVAMNLVCVDTPGAGTHTYQIRYGPNDVVNMIWNGLSGSGIFGPSNITTMTAMEIKV